jgi:modification methylase
LKTSHQIFYKNAIDFPELTNESVDLMVTSPPYPMVEMWDKIFSKQNPAIKNDLDSKNGNAAFELMHKELDKVWTEVYRVLKKGGLACINVGDATRKIGKDFQLYANHSRILQNCQKLGFSPLPEILWRKQTNAPNKFMGSGMLPASAYITLEHEFVLVLRKGGKREFKTEEEKLKRMQSAFFWEERNLWFSDIWEDLKGAKQTNINPTVRERSGAYPFDLPYRLINMFSLREDTVLDPFLGTGTTMAAAISAARNSIGIEIDPSFKISLQNRFEDLVRFSNKLIETRIENHLLFVDAQKEKKRLLKYTNKVYDFPVVTNQEVELVFDKLKKVTVNDDFVEVEYTKDHNIDH